MKSKFHIIVAAACLVMLTACGGGSKKNETVVVPQPAYAVKDVTVGTGTDKSTLAENGDLVAVAYTAYLYDAAKTDGIGEKVESSVDIGATAPPFVLGVGGTVSIGGTIPSGWDLAVPGMRIGGVRLATLPANLAYGAAARVVVKPVNGNTYAEIKANSPLVYRLQLVGVTKQTVRPVTPQPTELGVTEVAIGNGNLAATGNNVTVQYTTWLYDGSRQDFKGTRIDPLAGAATNSSELKFVIGAANLASGFSAGTAGMRVGGKRTVLVPSALAYGAAGQGPVPPNTALVFDIELKSIN